MADNHYNVIRLDRSQTGPYKHFDYFLRVVCKECRWKFAKIRKFVFEISCL